MTDILQAMARALSKTAQEVRSPDSGLNWRVRDPVEFIFELLSRHLLEQTTTPKAIEKPLDRSAMAVDGWVEGIVSIGLNDAVDNDLEGFLDLLSMRLVGDDLLMDNNYEVVGIGPGADELLIRVSGNAENCFRGEADVASMVDPCVCDDCGYTASHSKLPDAKDLLQRLTLGCQYTDKECPKCGALCFPKMKPTKP